MSSIVSVCFKVILGRNRTQFVNYYHDLTRVPKRTIEKESKITQTGIGLMVYGVVKIRLHERNN